ncbi:penicillin-binding protein 1C [Sutterella sp.]|uniref:penicillin-binding protein 1C n=1 Tax=Sutterella sp. TaxID=1981025 RepID=UPI0026E0F568|nr:penicillin-binding protein 1C [Sutterella sp.]MDO5531785.1 penicillin-binding protein 1C [Sutterella sp.]
MQILRRLVGLVLIVAIFAVIIAGACGFVWKKAKESPVPPLLDGIPFSTVVYSAEGDFLSIRPASDGIFRMRVDLAQIDRKLVDATIFYEDRNFYGHHGVNPASLVRAGLETLLGSRRIGASTLTMQLARMRLGLATNTPRGKVKQIWHALRYEAHYSKDEILEAYLNLAPYGGNVEGAGAAARIWFGHDAKRLSAAEATALAVIPQNPVKRRPSKEGNEVLDAARMRLGAEMIRAGVFPATYEEPVKAPLKVSEPGDLALIAPHYVRMAVAAAGKDAGTLRGTLNLTLQRSMEGLVKDTVARLSPFGIRNAALAVVDSRDRSLLAIVGSADFRSDEIAGEVNAWNAKRSPGSTLKPFVYGLALDQGLIHEKTVLIDRPGSFGGWAPENADGAFRGPLTAADALVLSRNLPAAELERDLSPGLYELLQRAGVKLPHEKSWYGLSIVLGGAEVTMGDLAKLYTMLAGDGLLRPIRVLADQSQAAEGEVLSREAAFVVQRMLESRGESVTAAGAARPLLYKTGTSNGWRDAWTAGSVGPYVIVVWVGDFHGAPNPQLQGARIAAPLFKAAAARLAAEPSLTWPVPRKPADEAFVKGLRVAQEPVCTATGDLDTSLCPEKTVAWILPGKTSVRDSGVFREILVRDSTGLRACREEEGVTRKAWEFWPTHFQKVFLEAGIVKAPPPPWERGCERTAGRTGGRPPAIVSPRSGVVLYTAPDAATARTVLSAGTDPDAKLVYWYAGNAFLGVTEPRRTLVWRAPAGRHRLTATDDLGRTSSMWVNVKRP